MRYISYNVGYGARGRMGLGLNKPNKRKIKVEKVKKRLDKHELLSEDQAHLDNIKQEMLDACVKQ